jgi:hypothetical protein
MVVALLIVLLLVLLASFLANDAAALFDERRLPPAAKRGQVLERAAPGPSKKFWRVRPQVERQRSRHARSCCEPSRRLDAVKRRWSGSISAPK